MVMSPKEFMAMLHNKGLALNYQQDVSVMKNLYEGA